MDFAMAVLGLLAKEQPILADFLRHAVEQNPGHPLAQKVSDILPAKSRAREEAEKR